MHLFRTMCTRDPGPRQAKLAAATSGPSRQPSRAAIRKMRRQGDRELGTALVVSVRPSQPAKSKKVTCRKDVGAGERKAEGVGVWVWMGATHAEMEI